MGRLGGVGRTAGVVAGCALDVELTSAPEPVVAEIDETLRRRALRR